MKIGKKIMKRVGIVMGTLLIIAVIVHTVLNILWGRELRHKIAELKARGAPVTIADIRPTPVPDEENAAVLYNKAFMLMTSGEGGKPYVPNKDGDKNNKVIETILDVKSHSDISEWTEKQREEISKLVDSRDIQYIYAVLEEASRRPKCNFNLKYEEGLALIWLPHLRMMRAVASLLSVKALLEAESGNMSRAFDTILTGLRISSHLKDEPYLISQYIRIQCDHIMVDCIKGTSNSKDIPREKAALIINELSSHIDVTPFIRCMDGERVIFGSVVERILKGDRISLKDMVGKLSLKESLMIRIYESFLCRPILKKDFTWFLTLMSEIRKYYNLPYYEFALEIKHNPIEKPMPKYCLYTRMTLPAFKKAQHNMVAIQAYVEICRAGLALKIYKAKNGGYPEELDKLAPDILEEIPADPFTGENLIYSKSVDGFILYSLGRNMKDDGGRKKEHKWNGDYDIVWKCDQ